jgi:hypothetical protein
MVIPSSPVCHMLQQKCKKHIFSYSIVSYLPIVTGMGRLIILNESTITEMIRVINAYPGRRDGKL